MFLVDANILSEPTRLIPNRRVLDWIDLHLPDCSIDPIILGEIRYGIYILPPGSRKRRLEKWFVHGVEKLRCVPWDAAIALRWAKLLSDLRAARHSMPVKDSLIAATALTLNLTLVTHNTPDFRHAGARLLDPFTA